MVDVLGMIRAELAGIAKAIRELVAELRDIRKAIGYGRGQGGGFWDNE